MTDNATQTFSVCAVEDSCPLGLNIRTPVPCCEHTASMLAFAAYSKYGNIVTLFTVLNPLDPETQHSSGIFAGR